MIHQIKKLLPSSVKNILKYLTKLCRQQINWLQRKLRKVYRLFFKNNSVNTSYNFAILCIKKTVYADMVIANINSLHYLNPNHTATIYCDTVCFNYLSKRKNKFDYFEKVFLKDSYGVAIKPWQHYKIEVHIEASRNNQIDTDADGIWHDDPIIDREKITMLAMAYRMKEVPQDVNLIEKIFSKKEWLEFRHCVAAFVSMPARYMTDKVSSDMRYLNEFIFNHPLDFLSTEIEKNTIRRLSEEYAVNFAIQSNYSQELLVTLKDEDGPGSKKSLQSLYYGCMNKIIE